MKLFWNQAQKRVLEIMRLLSGSNQFSFQYLQCDRLRFYKPKTQILISFSQNNFKFFFGARSDWAISFHRISIVTHQIAQHFIFCVYSGVSHQIILHKKLTIHYNYMLQANHHRRKSVTSEAPTSDTPLRPQAIPLTLRPTKDPDFPPELELQVDLNEFPGYQHLSLIQKFEDLQIGDSLHFRKRSEADGRTILDFISQKIRSRVMSEEFREIHQHF